MAKKRSKGDEPERPGTPWRDNLEALTVAVLMAVVLKYFVVEAYKIPSGSMQPTLMGNEETGIFDRILVDKLSYHFRDPTRWEVAVFKYPLDRSKNFVKRIVGVGPERLTIEKGDVWHRASEDDAWMILRRPRNVLREMMRALDLGDPPSGKPSRWSVVRADAPAAWTLAGRSVAARGEGTMRFEHDRIGLGSVMDGYTDGYPPGLAHDVRWTRPAGMNEVGDLRIDGEVTALEGLESLVIELDEGTRAYRFTLPGPAAPVDAEATIDVRGLETPVTATSARAGQVRLRAGQPLRFAAQNVDDLLTLELGERVIAELEVPAAEDARSGVRLSVKGEGADFADLQVRRDVYYTDDRVFDAEVALGPGEYYMLGDNTQDSSDSREWRYLELRLPRQAEVDESTEVTEVPGLPGLDGLDGKDGGEVVRGGWRPQENPVTLSTPSGRMTFFRDEWGERHAVPAGSEKRLGYVTAPAVPRGLITGRALLVFWPWSFERKLLRLHWVR